ncbi:hypothetical protein [Halomonas organivorans]|uniref:TRAP-type C4-dicarboxylate transport system substrate-binding protein n=1 Tax=Halomonas organivorans TaxID=257772 RepID=A0A7W5G778_9GAMM|nr:TRAP-type C4-dicarboxylate transport system substrate-binding protein [Halomonas organivorans]
MITRMPLKTLTVAVLGALAANAQAADYEWTFQTSETAGEPQFEMKKAWADDATPGL